jgi:hypothetical protein
MNVSHVQTRRSGVDADPPNSANTYFRGRWLIIARSATVGMVVLVLGLFFAGISPRYHELVTLSLQAERALQHLSPGVGRSLLEAVLSINFYPIYDLVVEITVVLGYVFAALVVFWRKSDDWVMMFFALGGITFATYDTRLLAALLATQPLLRIPISFLQAYGITGAVIMFYTLPDGRFVPTWTRRLTVIWIGWNLAWFLFPGLPINLSNPLTVSFSLFLAFSIWCYIGILALIYRYRHLSIRREQQQIRLLVISLTTVVTAYVAYYLPRVLVPSLNQPGISHILYNALGPTLYFTCQLLVPPAVLFSIVRYRLFDLDVIINRAMVYGTLTVILALIYIGLVITLQSFMHLLTGSISQQPPIIVASTLMIAALFQPLRRHIQAIIDRRFYRRKYDATRTLAAFSATLRDEVDLQQLHEQLLAVVEETMQPMHISLWLRPTEPARKHQTAWSSTPSRRHEWEQVAGMQHTKAEQIEASRHT